MVKKTKKPAAIAILGMHRSGTSMITRVVNVLGAYLGEAEEMMSAQPENPEGFWEHQRLYEFHERALVALDRAWDTALPLPDDWQNAPEISPFREELIELVRTRFGDRPLWAWKDPRTCILLPLWRDVLEQLDIDLRCLLIFRNPVDVARSLRTRNGFSMDEGYGLWLNHNLAMLQNSDGLPRAVAGYQQFLRNWEASLSTWAPALELPWSPDNEMLHSEVSKVVRKDLCHSASTLRDLTSEGCPKPVADLARILNAMAKSGSAGSTSQMTRITRLAESHASLAKLYAHDFERTRRERHALRERLTEQNGQRHISPAFEEQLSTLKSKLKNSEQALAKAEEQRQATRQAHAEAERKRDMLQSQLERSKQALAEEEAQRHTMQEALAAAEQKRAALEQQLKRRDQEMRAAKRRVTDFVRELAATRVQRETIESRLQLREREATEADSLMNDYERQLTEAQLERQTAEKRLEQRQHELDESQARLADHSKALADALIQRETSERQLELRANELTDLHARQADYESQLASARAMAKERDRELNDARGLLNKRERQFVSRLAESEERVEEQEHQIEEYRSLVNERNRSLQSARDELAELERLSEARKESYEREVAEASHQLNAREADLERLRHSTDEVWMQLEHEREQAREKHASYEQRLADARGLAEGHEREREQFNRQHASIEEQLADARAVAEDRERERAVAQGKADEIWRQLLAEREMVEARVDRIYQTYSWRVTRPLRAVLDASKAIIRKIRTIGRATAVQPVVGEASPEDIDLVASDSTAGEIAATSSALVASNDPAADESTLPQSGRVPKLIAFYLPQFHPIPENDEWWGKGFTEWTNVSKAKALFEGHHQPRRPTDLGYYDLRLPEVREAQAELARAHGVHGFCYHYYWFDRRRVLERPLDDVLLSGQPDFPFCICWANESWSRRWDGSESDILIAQNYSDGFAERFAEDAVRYLRDPRYIRIDGRPMLIVYRIDQIPDIEQVVATWRRIFREQGIGEVFLGAVEGFGMTNPTRFGFDAAIEFPPHNPPDDESQPSEAEQRKSVANLDPSFSGILRDYRETARSRSALKPGGYPLFRGVMPSWDNTARTGTRAMIYHHATPLVYQQWLTATLRSAEAFSAPHEPVVFVNAWNEWAEGAYLEPDDAHGYDYIEATRAALESVGPNVTELRDDQAPVTEIGGRAEVSIVIPAFNQAHLTRRCLESLRRHEASFPFEVLLVDDCSTDETPALAQQMPWVRYIRREENGGFGSTCNLGAEHASGEFVVFLNNDTEVCDGWLDALRETFDHWPNAGLVGSKLVLMDGTMQECGSLLFRDGSAANFGRGGDPQDPRYCYARETDYVSGAAIMIRKSLFEELGGFDDRYEPAYYEDVDLALSVRERELQVVVNPHAVVRHLEGGTAGTDTSKGIKRYQVINQKKFVERWRQVLSGFPVRPAGEPELRVREPRVLVVDWIIPMSDKDAGSLRMAAMLECLRRLDLQVTIAARDLSCQPGYELPLEKIGIEVLRQPHYKSLEKYLKREGASFDVVILSRRDTAIRQIDAIQRHCTKARLVFDTCDLHFVREARQAALGESDISERKLEKMKALELDFISRSDTCIAVSPQEKDVLQECLPEQDVRVVSIIFDPKPTPRSFADRAGLLFIGSFYHEPNVGAVLWYAREVLPLLNRNGFRPVLHVIGSNPPKELLELESEQIKIHGFVPDVDPFFDQCRLSIAPLRYGAGVKGKIIQSLALGLPCVTSTIGAEGTFLLDGVSGMVADDAAGFASRLEAAYQNEALWATLREHGLGNIEKYFSSDVATDVLGDLILGPASVERARRQS